MIALQTLAGHPVTHIVFSPDGSTVAVAQPHYGVTLLERTTGHTLGVCEMPRRDVLTGLTFCGAGRFLAAASTKGVEVFDATTGALASTDFSSYLKGLQLSDTGTVTVGVGAKASRVEWKSDPSTNPAFGYQSFGRSSPLAVDAISLDGQFAIFDVGTRSCRTNALYDFKVGRKVATIAHAEADPLHLKPGGAKFCPRGRRFAINDGRTLDVYDIDAPSEESEDEQQADNPLVQLGNGANQKTVAAPPIPHAVLEPMFTLKPEKVSGELWYPPFVLLPNGRGLLVKRPRNRVQLWDAPTGTLVNDWSWRFEWVTCVAVSADGLTAVAGGRFGRLLLWDLD